jgi:mannitol/fructose-specific phosphotransferase system IIA component (Ntr-type)
MAGTLALLLDPARISLDVQSTRGVAALYEIARLLDGQPEVTNFQGFYAELLARERLDTTCLGNEVAVPHARTEHVAKLVMAVGRSDQGVFFEDSGQTARLLFVLGTPRSGFGDYLQVVGMLCRIIKDPSNCESLMKAPDAPAFVRTLLDMERRVQAGRSRPSPA